MCAKRFGKVALPRPEEAPLGKQVNPSQMNGTLSNQMLVATIPAMGSRLTLHSRLHSSCIHLGRSRVNGMRFAVLTAMAFLALFRMEAHEWHRDDDTHVIRFSSLTPAELSARVQERFAAHQNGTMLTDKPADVIVSRSALNPSSKVPPMASCFNAFGAAVKTRWDEQFLYIESDGLPAHTLMVGITAWQQQVPLPQPYSGDNAWRIPLHPVPAHNPVSIRGRFLRGAIALAANGIPIFNPQNNRGEVSHEIGELDQWGGHCGRADDYHYHAAPLHLQSVLGASLPIAYALDGYPIYGLTEPDGSAPKALDAFNGHELPQLGYHYHASKTYPYVNGGFRGEVQERDGQVDPQPRAQPVRPAQAALRGARITGFSMSSDKRRFSLDYKVDGAAASILYSTQGDGLWSFRFQQPGGTVQQETYRPGERLGDGDGARGERRKGPRADRGAAEPWAGGVRPDREPAPRSSGPPAVVRPIPGFGLRCPALPAGGMLPVEFTGDGPGISPPLEWFGAPKGTKSYVLIMDHVDPEGRIKWYWTLYNIPADIQALPKSSAGIGIQGNNSINRRLGYAPPHSKGPGAKTYLLTLYALSESLHLDGPPESVDRQTLLAAMNGRVIGTADLKVVYTRNGVGAIKDRP